MHLGLLGAITFNSWSAVEYR